MPEAPKPSSYWRRASRVAMEGIAKPAACAAGGGAVIAALIAAWFGFAKKGEIGSMVFIGLVGAISAVVLEFLIRFLFIAPAKIHEKDRDIITDLNGQINALKERQSTAEAVGQQQSQRDAEKRAIMDKLAELLVSLESRLAVVKVTSIFDYRDLLKNGFDDDSLTVLDQISGFLGEKFGKAKAITFRSMLGFSNSPISPQVLASDTYAVFPKLWHQKLHMIDLLTFHAKKLQQIIEEEGR